MPSTDTQKHLDSLRSILKDGAFPGADLETVASWAHELKKAELQHKAFTNPALKDVWKALTSDIRNMNDILMRQKEINPEERGAIFRYRNILEAILATFAGAEARIEGLEKTIAEEEKHINTPTGN